jgi:ribose transport system permease protein
MAVLLTVLSGTGIGLLNGFAVYAAGANSIVVTIGMQFVIVGVVLAVVSGQHVYPEGLSDTFRTLASGRLIGVPFPVIIFAALVALLSILMSKTVFGRHVYAIGGDIEAARRAGIATVRTGTLTFALSGALAALAGVIIAALVGHVDPTAIAKYEFPALTAVVLGGTSLLGGEGRPADTAAAILVVSVITNVMTILNYQYPVQLLIQGIVLAAAVAFYSYRRSRI